jgi:phosphomannomutase
MDHVGPKLEQIAKQYADGTQSRLDGISVDYHDWHFNVRPSNTEPLLRLNLEALDPALMERKRDEVLAVIRGEA